MDELRTPQAAAMWLEETDGCLDAFVKQLDAETRASDVPHAIDIQKNIPIYSGDDVRGLASDISRRKALLSEWTDVLANGAGAIVIKQGMADLDVVDRASEVFDGLINREKAQSGGGGDHFAKAGSNDRVWNALEKHCLFDPENFARYYGSDCIAMAAEAWLGRGYQVTAQVNRVNPGGTAQKPHRDYHLGFMLPSQTLEFPRHVHAMSPFLTLQGAVAHCDMPLESGPTQLLPFSQRFLEGYLAFTREEFQDHFATHHVQLPLSKGDLLFFSPAIMHAAGNNVSSDIFRMANLLQISSAFGRAMENINRHRMCLALYPVLLQARQTGSIGAGEVRNAVLSCAEGYAFPTNLDRDPPIGGLAPKSQADLMLEALTNALGADEIADQLNQLEQRQQP
jgi:ectoine hydroxylase-related dioxygenase (phytanoyl-CoA dioxygenase family)